MKGKSRPQTRKGSENCSGTHNLEVIGSNPIAATNQFRDVDYGLTTLINIPFLLLPHPTKNQNQNFAFVFSASLRHLSYCLSALLFRAFSLQKKFARLRPSSAKPIHPALV